MATDVNSSEENQKNVDDNFTDVAIIGAGLAGTLLALSLSLHPPTLTTTTTTTGPKITIYESRPLNAPELSSGIILTPNGLQILSKLGVYDLIKDICWTNEYRTYKNERDETTRRVLVASEALYGFRNHRLYRRVLLQTIKDLCVEKGVEIRYQSRFDGVVSDADTDEVVKFLINEESRTTRLLVGADGIYSSVRGHISPDVRPEYTGTVGVLAHIAWSSVEWPTAGFERQCTIQGRPGAFFMIPETRDGELVMVGMQVRHPALSRVEWEELGVDADRMVEFFRRGYDDWHETGRKVIDAVCDPDGGKGSLYLWPFLRMPRLERWFSTSGNVLLVGDAAHAVPPSSGQGVNQALEDVWSLTLLLRGKKDRVATLRFWQGMRQKRVDRVYDWAVNVTGVQRMSEEERKLLIQEGKVPDPERDGTKGVDFFDDMRWLYHSGLEEEVDRFLTASD